MRAYLEGVCRRGRILAVCGLTWLSAGPPAISAQTTGGTVYIASVEGGVEAAIDAPWRLEPDVGSLPLYPTIPIVVSIHDTSVQSTEGPTVDLGRFCEMLVVEGDGASTWHKEIFTPDRLTEVERSDKWRTSSLPATNHRLCRLWQGEACSDDDRDDLDVGPSAEWHGTALYTPKEQRPGFDVHLTVQVRVAMGDGPCGPPRDGLYYDAPIDRFGPTTTNDSYVIVNRLSVHLGEEPLPRFDDGWVYGDLHYHSQGTDNEGESAYAYRPTLQAMRALGLDFLFATEHASDSDQITDVNVVHIDNLDFDLPAWVPFEDTIEDFVNGFVASLPLHEEIRTYAARDMNQQRFEALRALLNEPPGLKALGPYTFPTGANAEVLRVPGARRPARIFLGGEIDVVPEISAAEKASGWLSYGNDVKYRWADCLLDPNIVEKIHDKTNSLFCPSPFALAEPDPVTGRSSVHDIQGLGDDSAYARQHMVYLPKDGTRDDFFVTGDTSLFGGASEHLSELLRPEYSNTIVGKGYAFLAHPADAASGTGVGRLGPDIVPYSDVQLRIAFASPAILGLQLWNEDTRLQSGGPGSMAINGFPVQPWDGGNGVRFLWPRWLGPEPDRQYRELHHGLAMWDKMLLWGISPSQTAALSSWLAPGEPRRVFMAGGSDAHGDWNYRREGRFFGISSIVDTAIGKPRNLVHVGAGEETILDDQGHLHAVVSQRQVTEALASGNFGVTDGPALRIAVDINANRVIDDGDIPMGGISRLPFRGTWVPLIVEWKTTDEFGPVAGIDLYVGATNDALDVGLVYAPEGHGIHSASTRSGAASPDAYVDAEGRLHPVLQDGYMLDPSGRLHITPLAGEAKAGRRLVSLRANDFVVGRTRVAQEPPVCRENSYCGRPGYEQECANDDCTAPPPPTYHFDDVSLPDRIYVRAFARTTPKAGAQCSDPASNSRSTGQCIERLAFANPVWVDNTTAPDFNLTCTPSSLTIQTAGTLTCTVTSSNGVAAPVSLACANLPANATCSFNPPAVTPSPGGSASTTVAIAAGLMAPRGTFTIRVRGTSGALSRETSVALTVGSAAGPGALSAAYDSVLRAPSCREVGVSCETGTLVRGRARSGGEANTPNTIGGTCADGASGPAFQTWPAVDAIKVSTADRTPFAPGAAVRIEASVYAEGSGTEAVDFFAAADATQPGWTLIGTLVPRAVGVQTLSIGHRLSTGGRQAVRVQLRDQSASGACAVGGGNDRDDLVFAVSTGTP
jgi:hypothetical protein